MPFDKTMPNRVAPTLSQPVLLNLGATWKMDNKERWITVGINGKRVVQKVD